jgi:hypothetical protein
LTDFTIQRDAIRATSASVHPFSNTPSPKGIKASRIIGARAFIVDAADDTAESFHRKFGFTLLMLPTSKRDVPLDEGCRSNPQGRLEP